MKNITTLEKEGLILLGIGVLFFVLENILTVESLASFTTYGKFIFMAGAAFWTVGYFQRKKATKKE